MILIIRICRRNAGKQVLIAFARQQITVLQRVLAKFGQQGVTRRIRHNVETALVNGFARHRFLVVSRLGLGLNLHSFGSNFFKHISHHCGHIVGPLACIPEIHLTRCSIHCGDPKLDAGFPAASDQFKYLSGTRVPILFDSGRETPC